jgi:His/Glu/Gln/Arg/opine family amino acid ABC transporter permease subunit
MDALDALLAVLKGLPLTLLVTVAAMVVGLVGALPVAVGLRSRFMVVRGICRGFVDLGRGVPIIVWLFILKFGVSIGRFHFQPIQAAIIGLGIVSMAYLAEIYRGGLQALPRGQTEAGQALGLSGTTVLLRITLPQAVRMVSPSIATYFIGLFKDSSIASTIIVTEMVFQAQAFARQNPTVAGILPYVFAGVLYIVLSIPVALLARRLDARLREAQS